MYTWLLAAITNVVTQICYTLLATKIARKLETCEVCFWVDITNQAPSNTPWKFNCEVFFLKSYLWTQKERIVFQPSFFRGELSNFESVIGLLYRIYPTHQDSSGKCENLGTGIPKKTLKWNVILVVTGILARGLIQHVKNWKLRSLKLT